MRQLAVLVIRLYQRWISPRKRFCCAYRIHTGRSSCSSLGLRAVRRYGVLSGVSVLRRRTYLCGVANRRYSPQSLSMRRIKERGSCDLPCDSPCDGNSCDFPRVNLRGCTDYVSCCDCCDWPSRKEKKEKEDEIHLPGRGKAQ
ncbi:MAG: membrane protein insertion efficiency factor YidD [Rubrivivax sp.]